VLKATTAALCGWETAGKYDVCVVGAGPAGIGAALSAARNGLSVVLVESCGYAGGIATKSLVPNIFNLGLDGVQITGGIADELIRRMDAKGDVRFNDSCVHVEPEPIGNRPLTKRVTLRIESLKLEYRRMLEEAGVVCQFYTRMVDAVVGDDGRIDALLISRFEGPGLLYAETFIDATGDGLVFAAAGAYMRKISPDLQMHKSMFFYVAGVEKFDHEENCRIYKELYSQGKIPGNVWEYFGYSQSLDLGLYNIGICRTEGEAVSSTDMSRMDQVLREDVFRVMDFLHEKMPGFENCYLVSTPEQVGVRSGWGIAGIEDITMEYIDAGKSTNEPIALISRCYGAHSSRKGKCAAAWYKEQPGAIGLPMRTMLSRNIPNAVAAGRCISSDPYTIGTFRMISTCIAMGQAAGIMARVARDSSVTVRQVAYEPVREKLLQAGAILTYEK